MTPSCSTDTLGSRHRTSHIHHLRRGRLTSHQIASLRTGPLRYDLHAQTDGHQSTHHKRILTPPVQEPSKPTPSHAVRLSLITLSLLDPAPKLQDLCISGLRYKDFSPRASKIPKPEAVDMKAGNGTLGAGQHPPPKRGVFQPIAKFVSVFGAV